MLVLFQPAEFLIIGGAAGGALLIGSGPKILKTMISQLAGLPKSGPTKKDYLDLLAMLYELLTVARRDGIMALEGHIEHPESSAIIGKYPSFANNHHAVSFLSDTMRLIISGSGVQAHDLEALMDGDLETHHEESTKPSKVLMVTGDSLPGLGIVAAVLGIVITMGAIDGPAEEIGEKVGAALVGTFLGVLLSYGFVQPLANNLAGKTLLCRAQAGSPRFSQGLCGSDCRRVCPPFDLQRCPARIHRVGRSLPRDQGLIITGQAHYGIRQRKRSTHNRCKEARSS
jgi:chemotaxis protein MotA